MRAVQRGLSRLFDGWPYALVAFLYVATSPYHHGLNNPNEMVRVYMARAWFETKTFDIGPIIRIWGAVDDKAVRDGVLYSSKAPLQSLVGVFGYAAAKPILGSLGFPAKKRQVTHIMRLLGVSLFGIGLATWLIAWARRRAVELGARRSLGTAIGLAGALGTMLYPYSLTFTGHLLAALTAGGTVLLSVASTRKAPGTRDWRLIVVALGFLAGAAPFAEYPAALVAGPMLVAVFWRTKGRARRAELVGLLATGGSLPFVLGLWAHHELWGSPFETGYAFLENPGYVQTHGEGFFGVTYPKADALAGALFSPGTGLFFFSPVLLIGLYGLIRYGLRQKPPSPGAPPRSLAVAGLAGLLLSLYFIGAHRGWRGGWTVGPRYIIAVAPLLWVWTVEAQAGMRVRPWTAALGGLSIAFTGFAAALYPHLSDVFTNPLGTFVWPSYARGEFAYGLGHLTGLRGHGANLFHVLPLAFATLWVLAAGVERPAGTRVPGRYLWVPGVALAGIILVGSIPERDPVAARRENRRLWSFWEPENPRTARPVDRTGRRSAGLVHARSQWRHIKVEVEHPDDTRSPCIPDGLRLCRYGKEPWQRFQPDLLQIDGVQEPILFLHPIAGATVRAQLPTHPHAKTAVLWYGLADSAVTSGNASPVKLTVTQGSHTLGTAEASNTFGLQSLELTLTSTLSATLEVRAERDGARVFGFDWVLHRR